MASQDLAKAKNCLACHAVQTKLVGPAFKAVAAKYDSDKEAEANLVTKIIMGGAGTWGPLPMRANPQISKADSKELVKWILPQK